ncbi:bifunctional riboflavin kinase/FAD synthetase [Leucobacter sp. W1153]|uniref:bifunctional riboflavin kinase/FAD synthetase n=1 Tax=unclassified Leucobacter TaxID=2621730 RepID=UPI003F2D0204
MRIFTTVEEIPTGEFANGSSVAIGKFDGVHRGHRALLARTAEAASQRGLDPLVFTFANNPLSFLRPELCPAPIMSRAQRLDALGAAGVSACVMVPFDAALSAVSAEDFVAEILVRRLNVKHLCVGPDFRFGHRGVGDVSLLARMGEQWGFTVEVIDEVEDEQVGRVSSSRVREAILAGDVARASRMMGRPVTVRGEVVHGDARGRVLGFPTANLGGEVEGLLPIDGVFAGWALVDGARHPAAVSVGVNMTFDPEGSPRVEAFLLDFSGDLYGKKIEVQFIERLRGMVAYSGVEALVAQIEEDVRATREILAAV